METSLECTRVPVLREFASEGVEHEAPTPVKTINNLSYLTGPRETRRRGGEHLQGSVFAEEQGRDGGGRSPLRREGGIGGSGGIRMDYGDI